MKPDQILVGHYQLVAPLGAGGFGHTYTARDLHLPGRPLCVIKQLTTVSLAEGVLPIAQRLFEQEAQMLYTLGEHLQIPRLLAHFEVDGAFYLAQEYVPGVPLSDRILPGNPWKEEDAIALAERCLSVLAFVHGKGVIHRDIKPANLLCRQRESNHHDSQSLDDIVLIDFGAVKQVRQAGLTLAEGALAEISQTVSLTIAIGTPGYMAIEQQSGQPRFSSDLYALGMVLVQALTGLTSAELAPDHDSGEIEWRSHAPDITPTFADFLDQLIRYDHRSRPANATIALQALQTLTTQPQPSITQPPIAPKATAAGPVDRQYRPILPFLSQHKQRLILGTVGLALFSGLSVSGYAYFTQRFSSTNAASNSRVQSTATTTADLTPAQIAQQAEFQGIQAAAEELRSPDTVTLTPNGLIGPDGEPFELPGASPSPNADIPQSAYALIDQADEQFAAQNYAAAIALYEQAKRLGLDRSDTLWEHCADLDRSNSPDARMVCARVSGLAADDSVTDFIIEASHQIAITQPERALLLLRQADKIEPGDPAIRWARGRALTQLGQSDRAIEELNAAVAAMPDSSTVWVSQGEALLEAGRLDDAQTAATQALTLEPQMEAALVLSQKIQAARNQ